LCVFAFSLSTFIPDFINAASFPSWLQPASAFSLGIYPQAGCRDVRVKADISDISDISQPDAEGSIPRLKAEAA